MSRQTLRTEHDNCPAVAGMVRRRGLVTLPVCAVLDISSTPSGPASIGEGQGDILIENDS